MTSTIRLSLACLILGSGVAFSPVMQDAGDKKKAEDLAAQVQALKEQAQKAEDRLALVEKKAKDTEAALAVVEKWLAAVPAACTALDAKMDSARVNGFEKAGPNPDAKRDVLDGLKAFAKALAAANGGKTAADGDTEEKH